MNTNQRVGWIFIKFMYKTRFLCTFVPIVTVVAAYFILPEENINAKVVVGMMIAIIGIFVAQIKRKSIK